MLHPGEGDRQDDSGLSQLIQMENVCQRNFLVELFQTSSIPGTQSATFLPSESRSGTVWHSNGEYGLSWEYSSSWTSLNSRTSRLFHPSVALSVKWEWTKLLFHREAVIIKWDTAHKVWTEAQCTANTLKSISGLYDWAWALDLLWCKLKVWPWESHLFSLGWKFLFWWTVMTVPSLRSLQISHPHICWTLSIRQTRF